MRSLRLRREDGASAVEFALIAPLLFLILFGILEWGIAFLQVQSIRTAVREGGRAAAVGAPTTVVQQKTIEASVGSIPNGQAGNVSVSRLCTPQQIGEDVVVSYDTADLPGGGVLVRIPLIPTITMSPVISASFRCEA
jgi:Flp pilus assembly protein TadG